MKNKKNEQEYSPNLIESKWQKIWEADKTFTPDLANAKNPYYNLMMFPYPSAEGLHVGNMYAFTGADVHGRFMRMLGRDVFEPIGLDGFGIHSENYALKVGKHPKKQAEISQRNFYRQLRATGNAYDWTRTLETYDPDYYRWTQWLFVQMFKQGLAYRKKAQVNWCPEDKTVLADEQVIDGKCERDGSIVEKRELEQWFFKITQYADRLLDGLTQIDWPEKIKIAQKLWIGRSEDTEIDFPLANSDLRIKVITTRADTIFGATFLVLAPEHEFIQRLKSQIRNWADVDGYIKAAKSKTDFERGQTKDKTGVRLEGLYAINPANKKQIPIFTADYVLGSYGTGAIMAVPAHDDRDFDFAKKFDLPIDHVIEQPDNPDILRVHIDDQDKSDLAQDLRKMGKEMEYWTPTLKRYDLSIKDKEKVATLFESSKVGSGDDWVRIKNGESFALEFDPAGIDFGTVYSGDGVHINSEFLNGLMNLEAIARMTEWLSQKGFGGNTVHYHLRDWLISRQRYWGPPIPMIYCQKCASEGKSWFTTEEAKQKDASSISYLVSRKNSKIQNTKYKIQNTASMAGWYPVPEDQLPVLLPDVEDWRPKGEGTSPLANHPEFYETKCPVCGLPARRETDVSDTFLDSAWYYLGYLNPRITNSKFQISNESKSIKEDQKLEIGNWKLEIPYDIDIVRRWCPVSIYIGGAEHSVLHLLYVRFVAMVLRDLKLSNRSKIIDNRLASKHPTSKIQYPISSLALPFQEPFPRFFAHGLIIKDGAKMSKSRGNVVIPDVYISKFGADALRLYLMFLGPFDNGGDFRDTGIEGMARFVRRVWTLLTKAQISPSASLRASNFKFQISNEIPNDETNKLDRKMHKTIKDVTEDIQSFKYNTAISRLMEYQNMLSDFYTKYKILDTKYCKSFLLLLAPFAPHMTEELFQFFRTQNSLPRRQAGKLKTQKFKSIHFEPWPKYDKKYLVEEQVTVVVQINGKRRGEITIENKILNLPAGKAGIKDKIEGLAREAIRSYLEDKKIKKIIYVPGKIINFVV